MLSRGSWFLCDEFVEVYLARVERLLGLGNANTIRFWEDCWCRNRPLRLGFSSLYRITDAICYGE